MPCAVYGYSADFAARAQQAKHDAPPGHSGIGTTLTANMLSMSTMRATLTEVTTASAYEHMFALAQRLADGLAATIARDLRHAARQLREHCLPDASGTHP